MMRIKVDFKEEQPMKKPLYVAARFKTFSIALLVMPATKVIIAAN